jgi:hypothetical protein
LAPCPVTNPSGTTMIDALSRLGGDHRAIRVR